MPLYTLYIVNKAGGLIYNRDLSAVPKLPNNMYLRMASIFHSLHAISSQLAPVSEGGIETLEADTFTLQCLQTRTGLKFFVTAKPNTPHLDVFLKTVYAHYSDYVLKDPFYDLDMPIRCERFDRHIDLLSRGSSA